MDRLERIKDILINEVVNQMSNLSTLDAKELGEIIDVIKDIEETFYYHEVVEAMERGEKEHLPYEPSFKYNEYSPKWMDWDEDQDPICHTKEMKKCLKRLSIEMNEMIEEASTSEERKMIKQKLEELHNRITV